MKRVKRKSKPWLDTPDARLFNARVNAFGVSVVGVMFILLGGWEVLEYIYWPRLTTTRHMSLGMVWHRNSAVVLFALAVIMLSVVWVRVLLAHLAARREGGTR